MPSSHKRAEIVWIDDVFGRPEMIQRLENLNFWEEMFGAPDKIYRLMDIKIKLISNYVDAVEFIESLDKGLSTFYYFIVDLTLPLNQDTIDDCKPTYGKLVGNLLMEKKFAFSFLTSASELGELRAEEKELRLADFHIKNYHKNLSLPDSLKNKLLFKLQSNINWINVEEKFYDKISESSNIRNNQHEAFKYFPYLDDYKDFINVAEFNELDLNIPVFIKSHSFNNIYYEQQCVLLLLSETFHRNRYRLLDVHYFDLSITAPRDGDIKFNEFYAQLRGNIDRDVIWVIKLSQVNPELFKQLQETVRNQKCIFIVNDDEYESYLEHMMNSNYRLYELPYFKEQDYSKKKNLLNHILNLQIGEKLANREKMSDSSHEQIQSIYQEHPELLMDIQAYTALINPALEIETLSDSYEMVEWVLRLFSIFDTEKALVSNIIDNRPIAYDKLIGKEILNDLSDEHLKRIKEESATYWLRTSWGFPHGVSVDKYSLGTKRNDEWEMNSLRILAHLLTAIDETDNTTLLALKEIFVNEQIIAIIESKHKKNSRDDHTLIKWPHREYPMPSILHKKFEENNKHLWFNHKSLNYVDYSRKLSLFFDQLELYLDYYDKVLGFIRKTYKMLPEISHRFIRMIMEDIQEKKLSASDSLFKEEFKKYLYAMLSVSLIFTELITKQGPGKISEIEFFDSADATDLASYGPKLQQLRSTYMKRKVFYLKTDKIISNDLFQGNHSNSLKNEAFQLAETNTSNLCLDFKRIIENLEGSQDSISEFIKALEEDKMMEIDQKYVNRKDKYIGVDAYDTNVYTALLDNKFKQYSRMADLVNYFDFPFNILKYMDTILHFNLMVETRNKALEHNIKDFDHDLLYESFIFTYESLWLQYQYIISCIDEKDEIRDLTANFVKLNDRIIPVKMGEELNIKNRSDFNERIDSFYRIK